MPRLTWLLDKVTDLVIAVASGIVLYLILGGYISEPLAEIYPSLPTILIVSLVLAITVNIVYRFYKSVKFHRFVERTAVNLADYIERYVQLINCYNKASSSLLDRDIKEFDGIRIELLYSYPKIASAARITRMSYVDNLRGISVQNYDVIGNFLAKSPFVHDRLQMSYQKSDFEAEWDKGRTVLLSSLGFFG